MESNQFFNASVIWLYMSNFRCDKLLPNLHREYILGRQHCTISVSQKLTKHFWSILGCDFGPLVNRLTLWQGTTEREPKPLNNSWSPDPCLSFLDHHMVMIGFWIYQLGAQGEACSWPFKLTYLQYIKFFQHNHETIEFTCIPLKTWIYEPQNMLGGTNVLISACFLRGSKIQWQQGVTPYNEPTP